MADLQTILELSATQHKHLCPRQVLGARIGLAGAAVLGLEVPRTDKRLLIITETDGCFADGLEAATGCTMGHRTLRLADYGKIAATFVDVKTETAVFLSPLLHATINPSTQQKRKMNYVRQTKSTSRIYDRISSHCDRL